MTLGLGGTFEDERAHAESAPASARIVAIYRVDLGSFNLGDFRVTTTFRGDGYEMRGEGRFSILEGLVYDWRGSSASAGRVTPDGPEPSMYALNYTDGGKRGEQLRMTFDDGAVRNISIQPRTRALPGTIPVTREQLEGVLDPLSGAFLTARSAIPTATSASATRCCRCSMASSASISCSSRRRRCGCRTARPPPIRDRR
ncbi:hypothetical protein AUC69_10280 [Methyloceanibacter superfactus]|uniref:Uncharacterized protein n=1 Tax=Methyloceanibacter superfactus TaxID=1774969 RepID=A0A1E3VXJ8_9HYPH|nr:hypothetical protein AUC69_10280 [Methyloceanibacter superfactus]